MAKQIDNLKLIQVKQARLQGKSKVQALKDAGYAKGTAEHHSNEMTVIKRVDAQIIEEFNRENVTVDSVLRELEETRLLALQKQDYSTAGRMSELKGRFLAMFTDKQEIKQELRLTTEQEAEFNRLYGRIPPISDLGMLKNTG